MKGKHLGYRRKDGYWVISTTNVPVRSHCKSGEKYVNFEPSTGRWQLRIKRKSYGTFDTIAEAVALRDSL